MEMKEIESAVEGILFASGEPVQTDRICVALEAVFRAGLRGCDPKSL